MKDSFSLRNYVYVLFVAITFTAMNNAFAASIPGSRGLRSLTLSHGLSDLLVNVIYKDSAGFIWFGTESSVDRFDGNNIISFPVEGDARRSKRVLAITEGKEGTIYIGTSQGLFKWQKGEKALTRLFADKINFNVTSFATSEDGKIYIGTRNGLYIYNTNTHKLDHKLLVNDNLSNENEIIGLKIESDGSLYILTATKIWCLAPKTGQLTSISLPSKARATRICEIGKILYIGTEGDGVISFNSGTDTFGPSFKPGNGVVTSLSATKDNNLLVGTDGEGIYFYNPENVSEIHHLTTSSDSMRRLRSNSVYSTLSDDEGLLWIGYYQGGVDYTPFDIRVVNFEMNPILEDLSNLSIRDLSWNGNEYILIGTPEGLEFYNTAIPSMRTISKPEIDSNVIFTIEYLNGLFYIGTFHGGMYTMDPATGVISHYGPEELREASVFKILKDESGDLWVASSLGLYRFDDAQPSKYQHFTSANSQLPSGNVYEIFFDSSGRGWICTENGVAVWNGSHLQSTGFPSGFINNMKIRVVFEDNDQNLYFAPDRGEIWKSDLSLQHFRPLAIGAPGRFSQFTSITQDKYGWLWMGTDKGLVRYNPNNEKYEIFNNADGNINSIYTLAEPLKGGDEFILLGTTSGMHRINLDLAREYEEKLKNFKLNVTDVASGGVSISDRLKLKGKSPEITLTKDESNITVFVSDFSLRYMEFVELEYMLEGEDSDWRWTDGSHPIEYRDLQPGSYTLRIREAGDPDSEIQLIIYKKGGMIWIWFALVLIIVIIAGGLGINAFMSRRQRHDSALLEQMAAVGKEQAAYSTARLSEEECKRLFRKLESVMKSDKPYTNPDLKSKVLAEMIGSSAHALSFLFNQYLHKSYYDYVNEYRVEEFKRMVREVDLSKYTLTTLAERCGFSSRASFFRHFKAITGQTPAEYIKK